MLLLALNALATSCLETNDLKADEVRQPTPPVEVLEAERNRILSIEKATRSTIGVFGTDGQGGGSGVIISPDGYALTNFHVTQPFGNRMRCGLSNGEMVEAVIVGIDPTGDLALIKLYGRNDFPSASIADSNTVQTGQWCFAAGNPFVLATNLKPTVTWGIVSGVHRYQYPSGTILEYTDCIQTDAAINPGNSGGPLYNADGDLIGINGRCSFEKRGRVNVGVGYAISINQAQLFLGHLMSGRIVDHATLGFNRRQRERSRGCLEYSGIQRRVSARCPLRRRDTSFGTIARSPRSISLRTFSGSIRRTRGFACGIDKSSRRSTRGFASTRLHTLEELEEIANGESPEGPEPEEKPGDTEKVEDPLKDRFEKRKGLCQLLLQSVGGRSRCRYS